MGRASVPRELHFEKLGDIHLELDRLEHAQSLGQLSAQGQWTPGQLLNHLAYWVNGAYTGIPLKPPLLVRVFMRMSKKQAIFGQMRPGIRIPKVPGGTLGTEDVPFEEGLRRYREALDRLRVQPPVLPSPAYGDLSHSEWIALACRHAELHLGHLTIREPAAKAEKTASI
jgi:hypothetical protein